MSIFTALVPFLVKEAPHADELLTGAETLLTSLVSIVQKLPAETREAQAAMTALETTSVQLLNGIAKLEPKAASQITSAVQHILVPLKAAAKPIAAAKKA